MWTLVVIVALMAAGAVLLAWASTPRELCLAYWAAGALLLAMGVIGQMLRGSVAEAWVILLGNILLLSGYGMLWMAMRAYSGLAVRWHWLAGIAVLWIALCFVPLIGDSLALRIAAFSVLASAMNILTLRDLRAAGPTVRIAERVFAAMLGLMLALQVVRGVVVLFWADPAEISVMSPGSAIFGIVGITSLFLASFMLVLMVRERSEQHFRRASQIDVLTGLPNRRSFLDEAVAACRDGGALAMLLLDVDQFKQVNDRFGHVVGDRVLVLFGEVLREGPLKAGVNGRLGGEEFGVLLRGADLAAAREAADAFRQTFRLASAGLMQMVGTQPFVSTVSIGIAFLEGPPRRAPGEAEAVLDLLCHRADMALYAAKAGGRDRVEIASEGDASFRLIAE